MLEPYDDAPPIFRLVDDDPSDEFEKICGAARRVFRQMQGPASKALSLEDWSVRLTRSDYDSARTRDAFRSDRHLT
jgi:hypothetical protein